MQLIPEWASLLIFYALQLAIWAATELSGVRPLAWAVRVWVAFLCFHTWSCVGEWKANFSQRKCRSEQFSPSHKRRPDLGTRPRSVSLPALIKARESFSASCPFKADLAGTGAAAAPPPAFHKHLDAAASARSPSPAASESSESSSGLSEASSRPSKSKSKSRSPSPKSPKSPKSPARSPERAHPRSPSPTPEMDHPREAPCPAPASSDSRPASRRASVVSFAPPRSPARSRSASPAPTPESSLWRRRGGSMKDKAEIPAGARAHRRGSAVPDLPMGKTLSEKLSDARAPVLDMDHVHLSLVDFLWGKIFIFLPLYWNFLFGGPNTLGVIRFGLCMLLKRSGLWRRTPMDAHKICANLLLGTSLSIYLKEIETKEGEPTVGKFEIADAPHVAKDQQVVFKNILATVDLDQQVLVRASYGGEEVPADALMVLLNMVGLFLTHPQLHAFSNWAVNPLSPDPFFRRCSLVTVMYNYAGFTNFGLVVDMLHRWGICSSGITVWDTMLTGIAQHPPHHAKLRELMRYSSFINTMVKIRNYFLNQFETHQQDFPGIDGEALFLASILHSIDHSRYVQLQNILDLDCPDEEYSADLELAKFALVGSADRLWLAPFFNVRLDCKSSPHPLFRNTYEFAYKLDKSIAAEMECCVMR